MTDLPMQGPPNVAAIIAARNAPDPFAETTYFVRAEPLTGEILSVGRCPVPMLERLSAHDGGLYLSTEILVDAQAAYVNLATSTVEPRTENPAFRDGAALKNLPLDGVLIVTSAADPFPRHFDIDTPEISVEFEYPGTYNVTVKSVRHFDKTFEVIAP